MNQLPVVQTFFNKPVRFFKASFEVEMTPRYGGIIGNKIILKTEAIPLPDYADAIKYDVEKIRQMILRNKETFMDFYRIELIPDALGRMQKTILMAQAMCDMITARLQASRIKDPETRAMVINFQRWVIFAFEAIRTGKLRPVRWNKGAEVDAGYLGILSLPPGRKTMKAVKEMAKYEGKSIQQIYRRLKAIRGSNAITHKGVPRKSRSEKKAA